MAPRTSHAARRARHRILTVVLVIASGLALALPAPAGAGVADGWDHIDVGYSHSCGVTTTSELYCWGTGNEGQLGDGTTNTLLTQAIPRAVPPPAGRTWASVSAGEYHTCALTTDGAAWCWGVDQYGRLGNGPLLTDDFYPVPGEVDTPVGVSWASISAGRAHTCAIDTVGDAWCWGSDAQGQLGNGPGSTADAQAPSPVVDPGVAGWAFIDTGIGDSNNFGSQRTCAVTTTGVGYCWGDGEWGALGNGETTNDDHDSPSPIATPPGASWARLRPGLHHVCGVTTTGAGYCWGDNRSLQLGPDAGSPSEPEPVAVTPPPGATWTDIVAGSFSTCGLTSLGGLWCWGSESPAGELGNTVGVFEPQPAPVEVATPVGVTWTTVVSSSDHTCAVDDEGTGWCWGSDAWGKLGNGATTGDQHEPSMVASEVIAGDQTISFGSLPDRAIGDPPFLVSASATSGLPVSFAAAGSCTVTGTTVTLTGAGSCTITATQAGNASWNPAPPQERTFSINPPATISVTDWTQDYDGTPKAVTVTTDPPGLATTVTYDGSPTPPTDVFAYAVLVTLADPGYTASPVSGTLTIQPGPQTIDLPQPADAVLGDAPRALTATATSGLPVTLEATGACSLSGDELAFTAVGVCTITANQAGDGSWLPAPEVQRTLTVAPIPATIIVGTWLSTYDGSPKPISVTTDPPGLAVTVTYAGSATPPTDAGPYAVHIELAETDYQATPVDGNYVIARADQAVNVDPLTNGTVGDPPRTLTATATSGLEVTFAASGACTNTGNELFLVAGGTCTVTATQAGNSNWHAAAPVVHTFTVAKAEQTITVSTPDPMRRYDLPQVITASSSAGLPVDLAASGPCTLGPDGIQPTGVGTCTITATQDGSATHLPAPPVERTVVIAAGFTDVGLDHPFRDDIHWLVDEGITTGFPDGTYQPGAPVSRQSMAAFLWRYAGEPAPPAGAPTFTDVGPTHPFATPIAWLASTGITTGFPDGTFRPGAPVSRQSMAAFLHRYEAWATA